MSTEVAGKTKGSGRGKKKGRAQAKPVIALGLTFGPNLRRCRRAAGYTQEALAERAEVHRTQISLLERGLRNPGYDMITKLVGALGIDPSSLFEGGTWVPSEEGREGRFEYVTGKDR